MISLTRTDESVVGRWWWSVDRWTLACLGALIIFGIVLIQAASPEFVNRHNLPPTYFVKNHLILLAPALALMFGLSVQPLRHIRLFAFALLPAALIGVALTLVMGTEVKGATRWLALPGTSLQPSEFVKPAFIIVSAWLFARQCERRGRPAAGTSILLLLLCVGLIMQQPDFGMSALITITWSCQFFLAGLPLVFVGLVLLMLPAAGMAAYYLLPHVQSRIDRFIAPGKGENYQVDKALEAFSNGGAFGTGAGGGTVKLTLPDAHCDFIFAVAGEEMGLVACLVIVLLYATIVLRGFWRLRREQNLFVVLAASGLLLQFGLQAIINIASALHLMPTKGMTLPFISYGGSSLLAVSLAMGMLLALTRKRHGRGEA